MAYRIRYGEDERRSRAGARCLAQMLMAAVLLVCLLLANELPGGEERLTEVFLPRSETATQAMAQTLSQGGTLREAVVVFCRQVLEDAGYGTQIPG